MKKRRIGILGGTFQPIHNGHLAMARTALAQLSLDRIAFLIAGQPPHKTMQGDATNDDRLAMVQAAIADESAFFACTDELDRPGLSYTADTLSAWRKRNPGDELYFILGSDMLRSFPHWHEPKTVARLCTIVCFIRDGQSGDEADAQDAVVHQYGGNVTLLPAVSDLSSTAVRERIEAALPITGMVPAAVEDYIYQHMLYQPHDVLDRYFRLRDALSRERLAHTLYTVQRAIALAYENGCDTVKARSAALLHDCAKQLPTPFLEILSGEDFIVPPVLHASAGAVVAKTVYQMQDDAVLRAIRLHSTGDAGMTTLDKVLYMADITERSRSFPRVSQLRSERDLDKAMLLAIEGTLCYIQGAGLPLHPSTLRAYKDLGGKE